MYELFDSLAMADMRQLNEGNLPHSAIVLAHVQPAGSGASVKAGYWAPENGIAIPCRLKARRPTEQLERTRPTHRGLYTVTFAATVDIDPAKRLRVTGTTNDEPWFVDLDIDAVESPGSYEMMRAIQCTDVGYNLRFTAPDPAAAIHADVSYQFVVEAVDHAGAVLQGIPFVWSSADPAIASVSDTGLVTGRDWGTVRISARAGHVAAVRDIAVIGLYDTRSIWSEHSVVFNVPATSGLYAPEKITMSSPAGHATEVHRGLPVGVLPAGAVIEEWVLRTGGNPATDADYRLVDTTSLNTAFVMRGRYTDVQIRVRSGGTAGQIRVDEIVTGIEEIVRNITATFNVPATIDSYAPERLTFLEVGRGLTSIWNEAALPAGSVMELWALIPGGNPVNDADYRIERALAFLPLFRTNFQAVLRTAQIRVKSGGTAGQVITHGIATIRARF